MEHQEEYQTLQRAKESVKSKTVELAEAIAHATLAADAFEQCQDEAGSGLIKPFISEEARCLTAQKALTATVQRLLRRESSGRAGQA